MPEDSKSFFNTLSYVLFYNFIRKDFILITLVLPMSIGLYNIFLILLTKTDFGLIVIVISPKSVFVLGGNKYGKGFL